MGSEATDARLQCPGVLSVDFVLHDRRDIPNSIRVAVREDIRYADVQRISGREPWIGKSPGTNHARRGVGDQRDGERWKQNGDVQTIDRSASF